MNIIKKIEEIRNKPENIRERYVWIGVGLCMLFIFAIWVFSFKTSFKQEKGADAVAPVKDLVDKSKKSIESIPNIDNMK